MRIYNITEAQALEYVTKIQAISQSIGTLNARLRLCKHGSKLHTAIWDKLSELGNDRAEISAALRECIKLGCGDGT
jgi:hypothetical protein